MEGYKATLISASKQLTTKEKILLKDTSDAVKLDAFTQEHGEVVIKPAFYATLSVHNEKSSNPDYMKYIIVDEDGTKYTTGSEAFWRSFTDIVDEMADAGDDEEYAIKVYRMPSKNYSGKDFLTCSII